MQTYSIPPAALTGTSESGVAARGAASHHGGPAALERNPALAHDLLRIRNTGSAMMATDLSNWLRGVFGRP
ncbi:hypothetical protein [Microbulbifer sp. S227A]|uniref:hypothetical protein n=1 Tax=Microbulbifer sp. S227A TaxID=3415131 RepID=UPI003C7DE862